MYIIVYDLNPPSHGISGDGKQTLVVELGVPQRTKLIRFPGFDLRLTFFSAWLWRLC